MKVLFGRIGCLLCGLLISVFAYAFDPGYHIVKRIPLGGEGGWDYLTVDSAARRLYISRGTHMMIVDLDKNIVAGDIADLSGVHGIALAPEFNRGFVASGKTNNVTIFDLKTMNVMNWANTGINPDAVVYDPFSKKVFIFNGGSNDATVIDASGMPVSTILLGGKPEFARSNCRGKIYVNIESTNEVVEIDTQNFTVTRRFYIVPGEEPVGLALDVDHHIVFSGCRNKYMTILDTDANRVVGTVQIGEGVDGNEFDPVTGYVFSSNRDGTLNIIQQTFPGTYEIAQTLETQKGSRTMVLDPVSHNIYLPAAKFADTPLNPGERPKPIPDTFEIIVVSTATVH